MSKRVSTSSPDPARPVPGPDDVHVCSLLAVHDVLEATKARYLVTIINEQLMLATPDRLDTANHLKLACNNIARPMPVDDCFRWLRQQEALASSLR